MKIAVRGGHNFQATGARGIIDETTEDRKVKDSVIKYLRQEGHEVLDVTPGNCDVNSDLAYGVNRSNEWGAEYFISIHFNKAYDSYNGAIGTETWIYGTGGQAEPLAKRIVDKLGTTGLKNRGVKVNSKLYELRATNMPAVIVETCFTEATEDVRIYSEKGFDAIGKLIAEGILNKSIQEPTITPTQPQNSENGEIFYRVVTGSYKDRTNAEVQMDKLRKAGFDSFIDILKK
ncbi:N-acetylmuramoyl-L-alanine amidase [Clostridium sp. YIM B02506]|uniref:N-acetylmuramoyl-L-alanine amidase n=1 Tax=Clostridium sp. YIM B02506 TaxID=2910680 RepID=UPI001EEE966A|nr:N-acetylmuramoyl-L-alanine amidase [Clostridium sp. YIM B02506]